ncbi:MAG: LytR C-terminal domain-containing protein [Nocardioides sp.]
MGIRRGRESRHRPDRDDRGVMFPSPLVLLTVIAISVAALAFVVTRNDGPRVREVDIAAKQGATSSPSPAEGESEPAGQSGSGDSPPKKPADPSIDRSRTFVEVYNNSGIAGLAAEVASRASGAGWNVVGSDNWVGTIPDSTVYYPPRLDAAAKLLARDLGIKRLRPAVEPMRFDRLTVILTR